MRLRTGMLMSEFLLLVSTSAFVGPARCQTLIKSSGVTIVKADLPQGKVEVSIRAATLDGDCASTCPASRVWAEWGAKKVIVIQEMNISVNGHSLAVPLSVYASLFQPGDATLQSTKGSVTLRIDGGQASESYFVLLSFDARGLRQLRLYDPDFPNHPLEITNFYLTTVGKRESSSRMRPKVTVSMSSAEPGRTLRPSLER
jgi:hypothetical protein